MLLVLLLLLAATQIPFVYRRFQLAALQTKINERSHSRVEPQPTKYRTYTGVIHVHTLLGGHSAGTFGELIAAAAGNNLDFVLMTEHPSPHFDTARQTLNGWHGKTLFVGGNEVSTEDGDRFLLLPGSANANRDTKQTTGELVGSEKRDGKLVLAAYPEKSQGWKQVDGVDGSEVYSLHTNAKQINPFVGFFDFWWSFGAYPELMFARNFRRPAENLRQFDELTANGKRLTLFAASDAHSNIGITLGDRANHEWLKIHLDPYARIFRLVRLHVLLEESQPFNQENLLTAIKNGNCFFAFDVLGDARGFSFTAESGAEQKTMGDETALSGNLVLKVKSPNTGRIVWLKNGTIVAQTENSIESDLKIVEAGVYRVEVYADEPGLNFVEMPWIVSNPIYVR